MKKILDRLNKIVFVAGIMAAIIILLMAVIDSVETIDGVWGTLFVICILLISVFAIFVVISMIMAIVDGVKKDKVAFLKKVLSNIVFISIVYMIPYGLVFFYEIEFPADLQLGNIVIRILITTLSIIGGEYMLANHSKEE
ncbi:MAG: hypothetical protein E7399_10370 [Ruminococcaceae bacterium]|nr:hypothetical protein [Oscillospiraceae bacterium]